MERPTGKIWGITRASSTVQEASPERQEAQIRAFCESLGWPEPTIVHEELGTSGMVRFRFRAGGSRLLREALPGDVIVVTMIDRLGRRLSDILDTHERFKRRRVRLINLQFAFFGESLSEEATLLALVLYGLVAEMERNILMERLNAGMARKKALGTYCHWPSFGKRKVKDKMGSHWEWDEEQLQYCYEIAKRLGQGERVTAIMADFRVRGIKDHRGLPFGQVIAKPGTKPRAAIHHNFFKARDFMLDNKADLPPPFDVLMEQVRDSRRKKLPRRKRPRPVEPKPDARDDWTLEDWRREYAYEIETAG